ncbi:acetoin utilization protein AcuC [Limibacillus sp. MBR-115]|jgi:acetoin utilization protein AcuC|uniref:acetoin utilization protein AcuC n=1 Tax=Limibacillus sp. MBR-115 TaxID=3156465 RepID=UPI003399EB7F
MVASEIYRTSSYGGRHPLSIPRVSTVVDVCRAMEWLSDDAYIDSPQATAQELARFHDPEYIAAVQRLEKEQQADADARQRFNLGVNGNPIYPEVFRRPATAAGASQLAGRLLRYGGIVHSPAGGTHHALRDRASGFCYFNDPVLAILSLLDQGCDRVFYLDIDAHHGDGVQIALSGEPRVFTCSMHEAGRWPMKKDELLGNLNDTGGGQALNLPVIEGFNDSEFRFLFESVVLPLIDRFKPDAVVLQCGCDGLADDPLSRLSLSNQAHWAAVRGLIGVAPRFLVLGGGGYNPWAVARCWSGVWAVLNGFDVPKRLPEGVVGILRSLIWRHSKGRNPPSHWMETLADLPNEGPLRPEIRDLAKAALM